MKGAVVLEWDLGCDMGGLLDDSWNALRIADADRKSTRYDA
jgi:hypothetical protein